MSFAAIDAQLTRKTFLAFAETITYNVASVQAICEWTTIDVGQHSFTPEPRLQVVLAYSDVPTPSYGDAIIRGSATYIVDRIEKIDDYEFIVLAK